MKTILLLILAFGLIVSLAFNAYLLYDMGEIWIELIDIHELLIEVLEHLQINRRVAI